VSCAETAEPIEMPFGRKTRLDPSNYNRAFDGGVHINAPGEYDESICVEAVMRSLATIAVVSSSRATSPEICFMPESVVQLSYYSTRVDQGCYLQHTFMPLV